MSGALASDVLSYAGYIVEAGLLVYLLARGHGKALWELVFYLAMSLGVIASRSYTLHKYGLASPQYGNCYWTTDLLLVLAAFVLVTSFFKRACSENPQMWQYVRFLLGTVLVAIALLSFFSLSSHKDKFFSFFIVEFSQNLYFASLVLTTLLYLMTLRMEVADDRLGMLVCGLGIEFAGPAAGLALTYLTRGNEVARVVGVYFFPLCDIGMILTWFYAISRVPGVEKAALSRLKPAPVFAEGNVSRF
ncbi:MAG TPA: hypothetical protein VFC10_02970 [Terriglobia bacterium]|jgi:hypothetical protein|nr:hypothetical protein [Terriglobia bacterium]